MLYISSYLCVCDMYVFVWVCAHKGTQARRVQRLTLNDFLGHSPPDGLRQGLSLKLELVDQTRCPMSSKDPPASVPQGSRDPPACATSTELQALAWLFIWVLGSQDGVLLHAQKTVEQLSPLLSPTCAISK